jgi:uncharacterized membrane protein YqjE
MEPDSNMQQSTEATRVALATASVSTLIATWASAAGKRVKVISELALAEAKLAALSLALMVFLAMLSAAFILGTWGLLMAGLIYALVQMQYSLWPVMLVLAGVHALLALFAWRGAVALSQNLEFGHTRAQVAKHKVQEQRESENAVAAATAQG